MLHFLCDLLMICLLVQISICDIQTMQIPDRLNLTVLVLGIGRQVVLALCSYGTAADSGCSPLAGGALDGLPAVLLPFAGVVLGGLLAAALPMYLLAVAFPGSLGGGDIKLAAAAGVYLGAAGVLRGTGAGIVAAGIYAAGCLLLHIKTARQTFPLGPFLALGYLGQIICSS